MYRHTMERCILVPALTNLLVMIILQQCWAAASISFASGIEKNKTILNTFHLNLIKKKLEQEINKHRGNGGNSTDGTNTTPTPEDNIDDHPQPYDPPLIFSVYHGKNLLKFKLNENELSSDTDITRVNLWVHVWKKERKRRRPRILRKPRKGKLIRIRVFSVQDETQKGKKIAEFRTRIQQTKWFKISLPVSIIQNPSTFVNETVLLRVECKRCNRKTRLVLPENQKCRKRKRKRKNKKNRKSGKAKNCRTMRVANSVRRPFIVIEKRRKELVRTRRSVVTDCDTIPIGNTYNSKCCKLPSYVNFSDLGLDDRIVIPSGYSTGSCIGKCPRARHNGRRTRLQASQERSRSRTSNRRPKCKPAETSSLMVWLFNENHDLMQAELAGLVVNSCTCR